MANATPSRLGDINQGGSDVYQLFLQVFSGEVMTTFDNANIMMDKHTVRTIASGESAQFPVIGDTSAAYHTPGVELTGDEINHAERVISVDQKLLASATISDVDEAMNHYDVRAPYAQKLGVALANTMDRNLLQVAVLAARASATITGGDGGSALTNASYGTDGDILAGGIFDAGQKFDEKNVPDDGSRYFACKPAQYNLLAQTTKVLNRDWGGSGAYANGTIPMIDNIAIVKTNQLPTSVISANTGERNTYDGTFTNTVGVAWHSSAIGTVKLRDIQSEMEWNLLRQVTFLVSKYICGHGILRPESAVELKTA